jgi:transketolase
MKQAEKDILQRIAHTVRALSADAIEKQLSGHPGLPLGAAEIGTYLFTKVMRHNPKNPNWMGRDRFVLSAGHGSMLLYSLLHICGYDLSIADLQSFRELNSRTPGHPEVGETPGVETTTGPLGQGIANATGMAIAQKFLAARFGSDLFDSKIWVLAGDGCLMEGISSESGSLAGTLNLDNLVIIYDSNDICLDGPVSDCMIEDVQRRYESYGFNVLNVDGYNWDQMEKVFSTARYEINKPTLIIAKTIIGKHCPNREGKSISHGNFLGPEEMSLFKKDIGWPGDKPFYVPEDVKKYFQEIGPVWAAGEKEWNDLFAGLIKKTPEKSQEWEIYKNKTVPADIENTLWDLDLEPNQATRKYNEVIIQIVANLLPFVVTGSADVASCDFTWIHDDEIIRKVDWNHRQIKFGVREFSMAAIATGMSLYGMVQPVVGTFLVFSDYMRNAIRMAALMHQKVIYVYSHDSIQIGQDGPTHQPVEHLMSLRLIPNLAMFRPGDENESKAAWATALQIEDQPVALCFTRNPVKSTVSDLTDIYARDGVKRGAYVLYGDSDSKIDVDIYSTGSDIHAAVGAAKMLEKDGSTVRVISVPCWEQFEKQDDAYKVVIFGSRSSLKVSIEAGIGLGWQRFVGNDGLIISLETYGASAPDVDLLDHFGFTAEKIYEKIKERLLAKNR